MLNSRFLCHPLPRPVIPSLTQTHTVSLSVAVPVPTLYIRHCLCPRSPFSRAFPVTVIASSHASHPRTPPLPCLWCAPSVGAIIATPPPRCHHLPWPVSISIWCVMVLFSDFSQVIFNTFFSFFSLFPSCIPFEGCPHRRQSIGVMVAWASLLRPSEPLMPMTRARVPPLCTTCHLPSLLLRRPRCRRHHCPAIAVQTPLRLLP
jgi:hypothetical protein